MSENDEYLAQFKSVTQTHGTLILRGFFTVHFKKQEWDVKDDKTD